jgi:hypothetical protein
MSKRSRSEDELALSSEAQRLRDAIRAAWEGATPPGQIAPHCQRPDCPAIAAYFSRRSWEAVRFDEMRAAVGASWDGPMHFLPPDAFAYFLPAFLLMFLDARRRIDVLAETTVRCVCPHEGWRPRVEGLSSAQQRVVLEFLRFVRARGSTMPELEAGIEFWERRVAG